MRKAKTIPKELDHGKLHSSKEGAFISHIRVRSESHQSHIRVTSESYQSHIRVVSESYQSHIRVTESHQSQIRVTSESHQSQMLCASRCSTIRNASKIPKIPALVYARL